MEIKARLMLGAYFLVFRCIILSAFNGIDIFMNSLEEYKRGERRQ